MVRNFSSISFHNFSTENRLRGYSLVFLRYAILQIKHKVYWLLICQIKQTQLNEDNTRKNNKRVGHYYIVGDKFMLDNHAAYKYETPYKGPFVITQCLTNGPVTLKCSGTKNGYNICRIKPHTSDTNIEDIKF